MTVDDSKEWKIASVDKVATVSLGQLCDVDRRTVRPDDPSVAPLPFLGMENVESDTGRLDLTVGSRIGNRKSAMFRFDERHVLYAKLRPYLNKVATPGFTGVCSTELVPLRPRRGVDRYFLANILRRRSTVEFALASAAGARMPRTDMDALMSMPAPFPPHDRQQKIVDVLELADSVRYLQTQVTDCLHDFSSALFSRLFGTQSDSVKKREIATLDEVAAVTAGDPAPQSPEAFDSTGPLFVRMQDVGRDHVNPALSVSGDRIAPDWLQRNRLRLFPAGSILIPKSGASVNLNHRAMLATDAHVVSHLAVVIPDLSRVDPQYLFWWSVGYDPRAQTQVTSLPSLKLSTLKKAILPLPPLDEQRRFARVAKRALSTATKIEAASRKAAALRESLMARLLEGDA